MAGKFSIEVETKNFNAHIKQFMEQTNLDNRTVIKKFAMDLLARIMTKNPVDTGRARAGWFPAATSLGITVFRGKQGTYKGPAEGSVSTQSSLNSYWIEIVNSVPYIIYLEYGHSKQAPWGMVRLSMREMRKAQLPRQMARSMKVSWNRFYTGGGSGIHYGD